MSALRLGAGLFPTEPIPRMVTLGKQAEELGFSHVWVGDSHLIWREPFVNMAAIALNTSKVIIGTGVTNPITRHPSVLASAYASLDEMAPGRFAVGIGLGDSSLETMGLKQARRGQLEQAIVQMRNVIEGREAELQSGKIHINFGRGQSIPFYLAASGPRMLELSGEIADGVIILVGVDAGALDQALARIEAGARRANRKLSDLDLVLWVPCAVSDTAARAKDAVKAHVARIVAHPLPFSLSQEEQEVLDEIRKAYNYYQHMDQKAKQAEVIPDWLVDKFAIAGTSQECAAKVAELRSSGIQQIAIIPYDVGSADRGETLRLFAKAAKASES